MTTMVNAAPVRGAHDMGSTDPMNPLLVPEVLRAVFIHLENVDLSKAALVHSTWAGIAIKFLYKDSPPLPLLGSRNNLIRRQRRAKLVERICGANEKSRRLSITVHDAEEMAPFLRQSKVIKSLHIRVTSDNLGSFFKAVGACTSLRQLRLEFDVFDSRIVQVAREDFTALRFAVSLERLEVIASEFPNLILHVGRNGIEFTPAEFETLGNALPLLESIEAPFEIPVSLDPLEDEQVNASRKKRSCDMVKEHGGLRFPNLRSLWVKGVRLPRSGSMREDLCSPDVSDGPQWEEYLAELARTSVRHVLQGMPVLEEFHLMKRPTALEEDTEAERRLDVLYEWNKIMEQVIREKLVTHRDGVGPYVAREGEVTDYISGFSDDDLDTNDFESDDNDDTDNESVAEGEQDYEVEESETRYGAVNESKDGVEKDDDEHEEITRGEKHADMSLLDDRVPLDNMAAFEPLTPMTGI